MSITQPLQAHEAGGMQACPACAVVPSAQRLAEMAALKDVRLVLSLPNGALRGLYRDGGTGGAGG